MKLLVATGNPGKLREYRRLLNDIDFEIVGLEDVGLGDMDVEETGTTFSENAILKAEAYAAASGLLTLADDSGLVVDALDGRPGVYSARYGGGNLDNAGRRAYLLREMQTIPDTERTARFVCVIALHHPETSATKTTEGTVEGRILQEERDAGKGFGYDPIFQPDGYDLSFGELDDDEKNRISHRGRAAAQVPGVLAVMVGE
jgi:XTP/dITP diphosphohydrolase